MKQAMIPAMRTKSVKATRWLPLLLMVLAMLPACASQSGESVLVRKWVLEYPPPPPIQDAILPTALKVSRLAAASGYNGQEMVYRPGPNQRGTYPYHNWLMAPADMLGDLLVRDLRSEQGYQAVFSSHETPKVRFLLEGGVLECLELNQPKGWQARLGLHITVLDLKHRGLPERVLMQKDYSFTMPIEKKGAAGFAQAASAAAQSLSAQVRADLRRAVQARLK